MKAMHLRLPDSLLEGIQNQAQKTHRQWPELAREYLARGLRKDEAENATLQSVAG